jgi:exonuclease III
MKIATDKVNGVNGRLVCLQDLKTDDTKSPHSPHRGGRIWSIWRRQRAHHGVAILGAIAVALREGAFLFLITSSV